MADNDGSITFSVWLDADEAEHELSNLKKKILGLEKDLAAKQEVRSGLEENLQRAGAAADEAKAKLAQLVAERDRLQALKPTDAGYLGREQQIAQINAELKEQEKIVKQVDREFAAAAAAVERQDAAIQRTTAQLNVEQTVYGEVQTQALAAGSAGTRGANAAAKAADKVSERLSKILNRIKTLAASALIFSVFTLALRNAREYMGKVLKTSEEFQAALARLKGALLTAFQPILSAAIPALTALINILTRAISLIARFTSLLFGTTAENSAASAEALYKEADALDAVGGAGGKATKSLAGFDEINQLSGAGGGGGKGGAAASQNAPDFMGSIQNQMSEIEIYLGGALLALGAILTFSGISPGLGIALMAAGAVTLVSAVTENWNAMPDSIRAALTKTLLVLGGAALVIGAILTFSGAKIPLGIGLMAAGAVALGGAAALNWKEVVNALKGEIGVLVAVASGALLALGLILTISGAALPLGIGLMVVGAAGLATEAVLNWDKIVAAVRGPIGLILAVAFGSLLAIGLLFTLSGAATPLGIGLMIAGAAGLATTAVLNWDKVKGFVEENLTQILLIGGGSLLALGLILALSGAALPLGIGLMIAGGAALGTAAALNWDVIKEKISGAWESITRWWRSTVAPVFTVDWWTEKLSVIGSGMKAAINAVLAAVESGINWIVNRINSLSFDVPDWVPLIGGSRFGFNLPTVSIPRLAAGAVIPPNREFLAVLGDQQRGTNIEAPLDTIVAAFRQALRENGGGSRTLVLQVDRQELGRIVFNAYNVENSRVGVRLGGAP